MGQFFSSSRHSKKAPLSQTTQAPDVKSTNVLGDTNLFTDGIGIMSMDFAAELAQEMSEQMEDAEFGSPSAFQIRYAGYKGVLAAWPDHLYRQIHQLTFRKSMCKFPSTNIDLEILNWAKFTPAYLNRQVVTLLSSLGVSNEAIINLQDRMLKILDTVLDSGMEALSFLEETSDIHSAPITMLRAGFEPKHEPHLLNMLLAIRVVKLDDLKTKTRIFVPKGRWLLGTVDETKTLEYGQCFIQVSGPTEAAKENRAGLRQSAPRVITGRVLFGKNSCMHPGDIRVLEAVDVPQLRHKVNELVLPTKGLRSHASKASGSDFDGDMYLGIWDKDLLPNASAEPMYYKAPCGTVDVVDSESLGLFSVDSMTNATLGVISNAHIVHADMSPLGAFDPKCLELSKQAARALDFPKTGVLGIMPRELAPKEYPDYMEKKGKPSYKSKKVIGIMYRAVKEKVAGISMGHQQGPQVEVSDEDEERSWFQSELSVTAAYDHDLVTPGYEIYLEEAWKVKCRWDRGNLNLMRHFGVSTEGELVTGHIVRLPNTSKRTLGDAKDRVKLAFKQHADECKALFLYGEGASAVPISHHENHDPNSIDAIGEIQVGEETRRQSIPSSAWIEVINSPETRARASAWYHVTYSREWVARGSENMREEQGGEFGESLDDSPNDIPILVSLPWVAALGVLVAIKKDKRKQLFAGV